jgi:hypothetical protein
MSRDVFMLIQSHLKLRSLFLDLAYHNVCALFQKIDTQKTNTTAYQEFRRIVVEKLISLLVGEIEERRKKKEKAALKTSPETANAVLGSTTGTAHWLLENKENQDENCFLCMFR